ncbi:WYL domain-containing protein [Levilactobacillus zymae]|uniref:helix-turn-helix transcriptional regulator n=1 Tax=Levilactobacillus zymae TaxID=267363 RepID=UPI0028B28049|nr:WYL domain-containing protein [Levilactobacillus zymae]MDT6980170.1 WYL domain-containing protein [Levilactobacillus zymae]
MESNARVAELMVRLMSGETLQQADLKKQYNVSLRTCQRDIAYIRRALTEYNVGEIEERPGSYRLARRSEDADLEMVLTTSNILLGSRALNSPELAATLDFLSASLSPAMRALVRKELTLPRGSYLPLSRPKPILHRLREIADCIVENQRIVFAYRSSRVTEPHPLTHHAQPVALFFENYYFYVAMLSQERGGYWLYRLDRIEKIYAKEAGEKLDYAERFSLQDHRQQTYLLDSGSLTQIRFIYRYYLQTVLDHFPGSRVLETRPDGSHLIEAYVKVDGAMFWLLSQGVHLQVVSPPSLVNRMRAELTAARDQYLN